MGLSFVIFGWEEKAVGDAKGRKTDKRNGVICSHRQNDRIENINFPCWTPSPEFAASATGFASVEREQPVAATMLDQEAGLL